MTLGQKKIKEKIIELNRLLSKDEAFDIYTEHVMKTNTACILKYNDGKFKRTSGDYPMWELENKASNWYRSALGSLVVQGELNISKSPDMEDNTFASKATCKKCLKVDAESDHGCGY